jgi:hypothetical protein
VAWPLSGYWKTGAYGLVDALWDGNPPAPGPMFLPEDGSLNFPYHHVPAIN